MSSVQHLREFIRQRLTAAAEEIFTEFEKTIVQYEEEMERQRRLLDVGWKPELKLRTAVLQPQHDIKEEVLADQPLCIQERSSSLDQEDLEPPQMKEEQEELCTIQEGEQLVLKEETDTFMVTVTYEESDQSEPELNSIQLLSHSSPETESHHQGASKYEYSGLARNAGHSNSVVGLSDSERHSNTDSSKKSVKCDMCGKGFKNKYHMKEHQRSHTGGKPYACETCGKGFSRSSHLSVHMRSHTGEKPYPCDRCGKSFRQSGHLSVHMRSHTGEKPYPCETCGKSFSCSSNLAVHMRSHTSERPYPCTACEKSFTDLSPLRMHMRTHFSENL